ncbi:MAG: tyrosine-type recombinase/integrase [Anaerolineales bacterium]|nr:tyrosine-type recombinase/integrase [Anaerolineales bacterium]
MYKASLTQAGLPDIRFHDLRHTAASLMVQHGIHPKVVQEHLGHSKINIALDIFYHVLPSLQDEAAAKIDSLMVGTGVEAQQGRSTCPQFTARA